ncbi:Clp protease N-terminal domain-containing protein [Streptomyces sp. NPDC001508]|uniref:Clp protease N-terminal domain-containing protein n=1 Tax=Streptomyces sp. NPDC001508 TaxID=3154656 RepID=UPI003331589D
MQPRIPRQTAHDQGTDRAGGDAGLSAELAAVVAGARRRAVRDGDRQIDTAHLLHSLLESDPDVRAVIGDAPQIARLLGYLVQRSIGYGLRWQNSVEDSGPIAVLRDAGPAGTQPKEPQQEPEPQEPEPQEPQPQEPEPNGPAPKGADSRETEGWSPLAAAAMRYATTRAALRGADRAVGADLLAAIVGDRQSRAVEVLGRAGIDMPGLLTRIDNRAGEYAADGEVS